jgi:hypothetical protein
MGPHFHRGVRVSLTTISAPRGYSNPLDATRMAGRGHVRALTLVQDGPSEWQAQTPSQLFAAVWRRDSIIALAYLNKFASPPCISH